MPGPDPGTPAVLRVARPTNDFGPLRRFYVEGLGLSVLAEFSGHAGFDGLILGAPHAPYHLEFTIEQGVLAPRAPSADMLVVFYLPDAAVFRTTLERMRASGAREVDAINPYWAGHGVTFEDPDGYRVVLQNSAWTV